MMYIAVIEGGSVSLDKETWWDEFHGWNSVWCKILHFHRVNYSSNCEICSKLLHRFPRSIQVETANLDMFLSVWKISQSYNLVCLEGVIGYEMIWRGERLQLLIWSDLLGAKIPTFYNFQIIGVKMFKTKWTQDGLNLSMSQFE